MVLVVGDLTFGAYINVNSVFDDLSVHCIFAVARSRASFFYSNFVSFGGYLLYIIFSIYNL